MAQIKFLTDSASDIPRALREELSIQVLPFPIAMGERELQDGFDFTPRSFTICSWPRRRFPPTPS